MAITGPDDIASTLETFADCLREGMDLQDTLADLAYFVIEAVQWAEMDWEIVFPRIRSKLPELGHSFPSGK